jgi:hypothetical protein
MPLNVKQICPEGTKRRSFLSQCLDFSAGKLNEADLRIWAAQPDNVTACKDM